MVQTLVISSFFRTFLTPTVTVLLKYLDPAIHTYFVFAL